MDDASVAALSVVAQACVYRNVIILPHFDRFVNIFALISRRKILESAMEADKTVGHAVKKGLYAPPAAIIIAHLGHFVNLFLDITGDRKKEYGREFEIFNRNWMREAGMEIAVQHPQRLLCSRTSEQRHLFSEVHCRFIIRNFCGIPCEAGIT